VAELPDFDDGPHLELIGELRALAREGASLAAILDRARAGLGSHAGAWTNTSLFLRAFDVTLEQASALGDAVNEPPDSVRRLSRVVSTLVPRTADMVHPDFGPDSVKEVARRLRSSTRPLWVGLRRELLPRAPPPEFALAEVYRKAPGHYVLLGVLGPDVVIFVYRAPPDLLDEGHIEEWSVVTNTDLSRRYRHALEHARRLLGQGGSG